MSDLSSGERLNRVEHTANEKQRGFVRPHAAVRMLTQSCNLTLAEVSVLLNVFLTYKNTG